MASADKNKFLIVLGLGAVAYILLESKKAAAEKGTKDAEEAGKDIGGGLGGVFQDAVDGVTDALGTRPKPGNQPRPQDVPEPIPGSVDEFFVPGGEQPFVPGVCTDWDSNIPMWARQKTIELLTMPLVTKAELLETATQWEMLGFPRAAKCLRNHANREN